MLMCLGKPRNVSALTAPLKARVEPADIFDVEWQRLKTKVTDRIRPNSFCATHGEWHQEEYPKDGGSR